MFLWLCQQFLHSAFETQYQKSHTVTMSDFLDECRKFTLTRWQGGGLQFCREGTFDTFETTTAI